MKGVFAIDIERCQCGGNLKLIAVIEEPAVIEKILKHIGLDPRPPPRARARRVELCQEVEAARASAGFYGTEGAAWPFPARVTNGCVKSCCYDESHMQDFAAGERFGRLARQLTACRGGDTLEFMEKGGLKFLYSAPSKVRASRWRFPASLGMRNTLEAQGMAASGGTSAAFAARVKTEYNGWGKWCVRRS